MRYWELHSCALTSLTRTQRIHACDAPTRHDVDHTFFFVALCALGHMDTVTVSKMALPWWFTPLYQHPKRKVLFYACIEQSYAPVVSNFIWFDSNGRKTHDVWMIFRLVFRAKIPWSSTNLAFLVSTGLAMTRFCAFISEKTAHSKRNGSLSVLRYTMPLYDRSGITSSRHGRRRLNCPNVIFQRPNLVKSYASMWT